MPPSDEFISTDNPPRANTWQVRWLVLGVLLVSGAIAVACFGNLDRVTVPVRQLVEPVSNMSLNSQILSLSQDKLRLYRTDTSRAADTAESLLSRLGVVDKTAADFMRSNPLVRDSLLAFAFGWAENMVQAAIKAVPLGQSAGQRILQILIDAIPDAIAHALALPDSQRQAFTPMLAILSAQHEHQYSRLFRS